MHMRSNELWKRLRMALISGMPHYFKMAGFKKTYFTFITFTYSSSKKRRIRREKSVWVKDIFRRKNVKREYKNLVRELQLGDRELFFR